MGEAGGRRRDEHAIPPKAGRGAIEEGRGCKIPTVEEPIPIAGEFLIFFKHARLFEGYSKSVYFSRETYGSEP